MAEQSQHNSILVADFGNVHTRLILIDLVEGQYRMIASSRARTTAEPPLGAVSIGLDHAAQRMTDLTGRRLIDEDGEQLLLIPETSGQGVDAFLATSSAGRPMRVFLVGLTPEISIISGERVLAGSYVTMVDLLSPNDLRSEEEQINAILTSNPDLILIVGGTDDGANDLVMDQVALIVKALSLIRRGHMPYVLYAGNKALRKAVYAALHDLTNVYFAPNVRPTLDAEQLFAAQLELALAYDDYRSRSPGGFNEVAQQSPISVVPTTQGYISALRYMSELPQPGLGPLIIDVGSANSLIMASVDKTPRYRINTELGVGHHAPQTLTTVGVEAVQRWLPQDMDEGELWDYIYNKQIYPATIPGTAEELLIEQALAREIVRLMVSTAREDWELGVGELLPDFQPIIGAGAVLTEAQHPGISALILLDALQPTGTVELRLDPHNLISATGVIAYLEPVMTVQTLDAGGLVNLGTAYCPTGRPRLGQTALTVTIKPAEGDVIKHTIKGGDIWMAPILPGIQADVTVRCARGLAINGKRRVRQKIIAGAAGIIFDARGRPLVLPRDRDRAARYLDWQMAMMGRVRRPKMPGEVEIEEDVVTAAPPVMDPAEPDLNALMPSLEALTSLADTDDE